MKNVLQKWIFIFCVSINASIAVAQTPNPENLSNDVFVSTTAFSKGTAITPDLEDIYKNYFEKRRSAMYYLENLQSTTDFLFYAKRFSKKDFLEKKNEYRTKGGADATVFDMINKQEDFYTTTVPNRTSEKVNTLLQLQEDKKDYTKYSAKEAINAYNSCLEYIEGMLLLSPENTTYLDLKTKNEVGKKEVEAFVSSGDYEKKLAERTTDQINAVELNSSKMADIYAEWAVNESVLYSGLGNTSTVSILSRQWKIIKDNKNIPLYKYIDVEAGVKGKDNKCYKVTGIVTKPFELDATYGKPVFKYEYKEVMNCEKLSK